MTTQHTSSYRLMRYGLSILTTLCLFTGCSIYRDAAIQGASDIGSVAGTALGLPIGVALTTVEATADTAQAVRRAPRLYDRTSGAAGSTKDVRYSTPLVTRTDPALRYTRSSDQNSIVVPDQASVAAIPQDRDLYLSDPALLHQVRFAKLPIGTSPRGDPATFRNDTARQSFWSPTR